MCVHSDIAAVGRFLYVVVGWPIPQPAVGHFSGFIT